jgi:hypothetical protein
VAVDLIDPVFMTPSAMLTSRLVLNAGGSPLAPSLLIQQL